jgi:hypothetical protein
MTELTTKEHEGFRSIFPTVRVLLESFYSRCGDREVLSIQKRESLRYAIDAEELSVAETQEVVRMDAKGSFDVAPLSFLFLMF